MSSHAFGRQAETDSAFPLDLQSSPAVRRWYAIFTIPQHEKSVVVHLNRRTVEAFVPTYESIRVWKNRQRVRLELPLFPCYVFANLGQRDRLKVLECPGVLRVIGNGHQHIPLQEAEVELLRGGFMGRKLEPFHDLVVGEKVRIKSGLLQGLEGTLVRKSSSFRFILSLELINQRAAVEVDANDLESAIA